MEQSAGEPVFKGVIVASIKIHELGRFLQSELAPQVAGNVGLMDKNGIIIYGSNPSLIGKYYLGEEFQSLVPEEIRGPYNSLLADLYKDLLEPKI